MGLPNSPVAKVLNSVHLLPVRWAHAELRQPEKKYRARPRTVRAKEKIPELTHQKKIQGPSLGLWGSKRKFQQMWVLSANPMFHCLVTLPSVACGGWCHRAANSRSSFFASELTLGLFNLEINSPRAMSTLYSCGLSKYFIPMITPWSN
jgi:hypothetical protein